ncbi:general transcription factor II-I repeat domain-containing protein 2A-like [Hyperolius riggenbachi]|uniref:general transcription factor II-I repeat domain-containing protein 2A-like n=1 Tax=Hyperolius riggenbachi TaxID=752182 RepID=UPI0035A2F863
MTITRRVEDLGSDLQLQLKKKASQFVMFSIAADESTDVSDVAQLLVFIRGVTPMFEITEELAAMKSMHGTTTGEDLFREVSEVINDLALDWSKLVGVTTDGAKSMVGRHNGLVARVSQKVIESNGSRPLGLHCIIHQQNLCGKQLNLEHVMKVVVHSVNFIRSHALNHRTFRKLLDEMESEHEDVIYHSEVCWLSRGRVLKHFFELRHEINIFMTGKSKQLPELGDPSWLWDLAIICDLTEYLNELNVKLQGKNKLICHVYADISAFKTKLQLFIEQAEQEILVHFPTCAALRQEQSSPFPRRKMIQLLKLLNESFEERFEDFHSLKNEICLFENPFSVKVSTAPSDLQLELIELQCQTSLQDNFREMLLPEFYAELPLQDFPNLQKHSLKMVTTFASTYVCEQTFLVMKRAKTGSRSRITDDHLHSVLRINVTNL